LMNKPRWSDQEKEYLLQLIKEHPGQTNIQYAGMLIDKFNRQFSEDSVRKQRKKVAPVTEKSTEYKETHEIHKDGSHTSDKLLRMSAEESKSVDYLLSAHGFDLSEWELVSARNNIWNVYSKEDKIQVLYSSKITVKPKTSSFSVKNLVERIENAKVKQRIIKIKPIIVEDKRLLEIPLFDAHFGVSDYDYYKPTQMKVYKTIQSRKWEEILFVIGSDMLHNDNFKGQTANGTQIEQVDMDKAWDDCELFYLPLIDEAIKQSNSVKIMYSPGNHDESISYAFVRMLKRMYPQVTFDYKVEERKVHTFEKVFIGVTHGDKARKNLHNLFPVEFPQEWSNAKVRELHSGHLHVEEGKDVFGMMIRTLATRNKTDEWHKKNGFVGAHKRFMLFEYSEEALESIHYV
jgi:hypothetical protein